MGIVLQTEWTRDALDGAMIAATFVRQKDTIWRRKRVADFLQPVFLLSIPFICRRFLVATLVHMVVNVRFRLSR